MLQEIITYIIVAVAVGISLWKMYKVLSRTKKKKKTLQKSVLTAPHNCSDCIADCSLRDAVPEIKKKNEKLCETTMKSIKDT